MMSVNVLQLPTFSIVLILFFLSLSFWWGGGGFSSFSTSYQMREKTEGYWADIFFDKTYSKVPVLRKKLTSFIVFLLYLFIYFWLHWVFITAHRVFHCSAWASVWLWHTGSVVCSTQAQLPCSTCDLISLTRNRIHIPRLEGRFLTAGPPGKSLSYF